MSQQECDTGAQLPHANVSPQSGMSSTRVYKRRMVPERRSAEVDDLTHGDYSQWHSLEELTVGKVSGPGNSSTRPHGASGFIHRLSILSHRRLNFIGSGTPDSDLLTPLQVTAWFNDDEEGGTYVSLTPTLTGNEEDLQVQEETNRLCRFLKTRLKRTPGEFQEDCDMLDNACRLFMSISEGQYGTSKSIALDLYSQKPRPRFQSTGPVNPGSSVVLRIGMIKSALGPLLFILNGDAHPDTDRIFEATVERASLPSESKALYRFYAEDSEGKNPVLRGNNPKAEVIEVNGSGCVQTDWVSSLISSLLRLSVEVSPSSQLGRY
ncbi:hypothetical protein TREMEDRAFT_64573 [Tremella mesenterica DSM 1558]|uniref:uncharacterized protein n=1 Tax=Tremella mesenterica (strain ATCC 24925 / CBS 8224 / DSM 1558 / NBRC 9311 / NRRL Y-6157 / RJB 2259-6 / UBC 559-6) TaxID=578456 RepID=UPI0003F4A508|nr:uncharacterized protein TREMEDRAFT_64573 [Tremella mesenterica DSM 1558]EIW67320.1 hypothetical protein TREMEDRAFT_64573 [Tremella mesenterica DSM 1558]